MLTLVLHIGKREVEAARPVSEIKSKKRRNINVSTAELCEKVVRARSKN